MTVISRFTGSNAIITYQNGVDAQAQTLPWSRGLSRLLLGLGAASWSLDPIYGTDRALP